MLSISFLHVKIDDDKFDSELIQRCHTTKLQIVIICPLIIKLDNGMVKSRLTQILRSDRTIGMLLDVKEVQMLDIHRDSKETYKFTSIAFTNYYFSSPSSLSILQQMAKMRDSRPRSIFCQQLFGNRTRHSGSSLKATAISDRNSHHKSNNAQKWRFQYNRERKEPR